MATQEAQEVQEVQPKVKEKLFRLKEEEDAKLPKLIELAHRLGLIEKQSFQEFMIFSINCAYDYMAREYEKKRGRRVKV